MSLNTAVSTPSIPEIGRPRRGPRVVRRAARMVVAVALLAGSVAAAPTAAHAEPPPSALVQIVDLSHDPSGLIRANIASSDPDFDPARVTAFVDSLPVGIRVAETHRRRAAAVVLAIDTSGSMAGSPIVAAQDAAERLLLHLPPADRVALVSFAGWPLTLSDFTTDRDVTRGGLAWLTAVGETALFDTVALAADLLGGQPADAPRVLVLLSDGRDSGFAVPGKAEGTVQAVIASGIEVHAFGLGDDVDVEYLEQLASASGGAYHPVADEASLAALFAALGTRLGDRYVIEIPVPPLTTGTHVVSLRTGAGDAGIEAALDVSNDNLFQAKPVVAVSTDLEAPIVIEISAGAARGALAFEASLDGVALPVVDGRVYIDPWLVAAGTRAVHVRALIGGAVAATRDVTVEIPARPPEITTTLDEGGRLEVRARVQAAGVPLLSVRDARTPGAPPLAQVTGARLVTDLPAGVGPLLIEVRGAGEVIASRELDATVAPPIGAGGDGSAALPLAAVVVVGLGGVAAAVLVLQRVRHRRRRSAIRVRARRLATGESLAPPPPSELGHVVVRTPDGTERDYAVGPRPLTIGRAPTCDIVLADPSIRPVHSRISGRRRGEFQVHGLRPTTGADRSPIDDWTVLHAGESIMVGEHVLTVLDQVVEPGLAS